MASIYKLVAERRDRNQSMRRKKNSRNINLFKDSIDEVQYRSPALLRNQTLRLRTLSDQPPGHDLPIPPATGFGSRRPTNDILMINIKNQIKDVDVKVDSLAKKIDDLSNSLIKLSRELNK